MTTETFYFIESIINVAFHEELENTSKIILGVEPNKDTNTHSKKVHEEKLARMNELRQSRSEIIDLLYTLEPIEGKEVDAKMPSNHFFMAKNAIDKEFDGEINNVQEKLNLLQPIKDSSKYAGEMYKIQEKRMESIMASKQKSVNLLYTIKP